MLLLHLTVMKTSNLTITWLVSGNEITYGGPGRDKQAF